VNTSVERFLEAATLVVLPGRCFQDFIGNTPVTLTPVAEPGSVFAGFTGACTASPPAPSR